MKTHMQVNGAIQPPLRQPLVQIATETVICRKDVSHIMYKPWIQS